jgi:hypothetical protein
MPLQEGGRFTPNSQIISPGVFTREIDQSFISQAVETIGGAIVAPFPKGPGFSPVKITTQSDLEAIFGKPDGILYGPYTAQQYLQEQGNVTVVRVGGLGGYDQKNPLAIVAEPGQYQRFNESSSFSGNLVNVVVVSGSTLASSSISGLLVVKFTSGIYSGSTVSVGTLSSSLSSATPVWSSGSLVSASLNGNSITGTLIPNTGTLTVSSSIVSSILCGVTSYSITGNVYGKYGNFDASTWLPETIDQLDDCGNLVTGSSDRNQKMLAILANTAYDTGQNLYGFSGSVLSSGSTLSSNYSLTLSTTYTDPDTNDLVSSSYGTYSFSLDSASPKYLTNVFGTDPKNGFIPVPVGAKLEAAYTYKSFPETISNVVAEMTQSGSWRIAAKVVSNGLKFSQDGVVAGLEDSAFDLKNAETPWINSQKISPFSGSVGNPTETTYNLFKVHTMSDGTDSNTAYKIEISNVKSAGTVAGSDFGSFTLAVREYSDTDKKPVYLEVFQNLNLDPDSADYVARRIGNRYNYINANGKILEFGDYSNQSRYIRVEMTTSPYPRTSIPYGFDAYACPVAGNLCELKTMPAMTYTSASLYSKQVGKYCSGIVFQSAPAGADTELSSLYPEGTSEGSERDNKAYFAPVPVGASAGLNTAFDLETVCGISPNDTPSTAVTNAKKRKFILGFQGGFDGASPSVPVLVGNDIVATNQQGFNCATNTSIGSYAYMQCLNALSNADEFDINMLVTPGLNYEYNPYLVTQGVELCENRGDTFYIFDIAPNKTAGASALDSVISLASEFDTNYAATYYPWVKIRDVNTNKIITVPPSVVMPAVYASSDRVGAEWFAPAGLNRGGIQSAVQVCDRLTHADRDLLYAGRVNPIAAFPGQGICVWGQKTLQVKPSALDRINVRRLLINLKKFASAQSKFLVFEQNVTTTRNKFLNSMNPYLQSIQQRSGIYAFKVVGDDSINTADLVDRGILYFKLYIQPSRTAEMIVIDFNVQSTGASFSE